VAIHADVLVPHAASMRSALGCRRTRACALAVGACVWFAATAASAGEIDAEVNALSPSVSWSVGSSKPVATYAVTLTNTSASNTINNGRLVATTTVLGGSAGAQAVFKSVSSGATCSVSPDGTRVDCSVGSLVIGQPKTFWLNFESPTSGTSINLTWDAVFDSGTPPGGSNGDSGKTSILLADIAATGVESAVPPNEAVAVYTGYLALPSSSDQFTTAIKVPSANSKSSTARVVESDISFELNCTNLRNFKRCFSSDIQIPDVTVPFSSVEGEYLTFTLSIDKSNFRGGAKIDKTLIVYNSIVNPDNLADPNNVINHTVQFCTAGTNGKAIPNSDCKTPCIKAANDYSSRKSPLGNWYGFQWEIIACKNGRYDLY
jgi:hypothetical protein